MEAGRRRTYQPIFSEQFDVRAADETTVKPPRRVPIRTCVACRTSGGKRTLVRVVRLPENEGVGLDPTGKRSGRGAYLCPTEACVTQALKQKKLERALKTPLPETVADALRALAAQETSAAGPEAGAGAPPSG